MRIKIYERKKLYLKWKFGITDLVVKDFSTGLWLAQKESYGWHEENGQENFSSGPENRLLQIILVCSHKHPGKSDTVRIESRGYYKKNGVQRIKSVQRLSGGKVKASSSFKVTLCFDLLNGGREPLSGRPRKAPSVL